MFTGQDMLAGITKHSGVCCKAFRHQGFVFFSKNQIIKASSRKAITKITGVGKRVAEV